MRNVFGIILTILLIAVLVLPMTSPILSIATPSTVRAQEEPEIEWIRQFGTASHDEALGISVDSSGIYVAGWTYGALPGQTSAGLIDAFVRKYDASGNELWTRQFGGAGDEEAMCISVDSSGIYVAGSTGGPLDSDAFVRKYDASGSEIWTRQFGTAYYDVAIGISVDSSGIYVVGATQGALPGQTSAGDWDAFVRKYDASGNELWTRQFGGADGEVASGISVDSSGIYVAGGTGGALPGQTSAGGADAFVRKYDASGNELWTRQFGTASLDEALGISVDSSGIYVAGWTIGALPGQTSAGGPDAFLAKLVEAEPTPEGGCFIATAAYGSYLDSHVETLRDFRDSYLVTNPVGEMLVSAYYELSPPVAEFIDEHPALKPMVRIGLLPAVAMSTVALSTTLAEKLAIVGALLMVSALTIVWMRRRRGKGVIS